MNSFSYNKGFAYIMLSNRWISLSRIKWSVCAHYSVFIAAIGFNAISFNSAQKCFYYIPDLRIDSFNIFYYKCLVKFFISE